MSLDLEKYKLSSPGLIPLSLWNELVDLVHSCVITSFVGGAYARTALGTQLWARGGGGGGETTSQPFDVILEGVGTPDPETGEYSSHTAKIVPGTVNGILPSNWDEEFSVSGSSMYYAIAVIQTDGTAINAVSIEIRTTAPSLQVPAIWATPTAVEYLFGLIKDGSAKRVIGAGSISLIPKVWLTVEKDEPVGPGELAYNRYYILG